MLKIFRESKHTSLAIKIILGLILLSFALFFGYQDLGQDFGQGAQTTIATVNDTPIRRGMFELYYERNLEEFKKMFPGNQLPDFASDLARSNTIRELAQRKILVDEALKLGLKVSDERLAETILASRKQDPHFDPIAYRHEFLPYFKQRYGVDYEQLLREDVIIDDLRRSFEGLTLSSQVPLTPKEVWNFEMVNFDPKVLEEAESVAALFISQVSKDAWSTLSKKYGVDLVKVGPVTISGREPLAPYVSRVQDMVPVFALTKDAPVLKAPLRHDGIITVVRLLDRSENKDPALVASSTPSSPFLDAWLKAKLAQAKIERLDK
ncbi:MAG: SurA N-terminal domain-containing protein [Deltaproteobacteria bacterium]|nr:SurA N-terminal domain-containing protein [Deltaproteobacteria bacterium]